MSARLVSPVLQRSDVLEGRVPRAARRLRAASALAARAGLASAPNFQGTIDQAETLATNSLGRAAFLVEREAGRQNQALVAEEALAAAGSVPGTPDEGLSSLRIRLTPREREVLQLMADGFNDHDIATRLFISARTASKHVSRILDKMGATSRSEAAVRAMHLGLA